MKEKIKEFTGETQNIKKSRLRTFTPFWGGTTKNQGTFRGSTRTYLRELANAEAIA